MGKTFVGLILIVVLCLGSSQAPQYIKSVEFLNLSPQTIQVAVMYQSGSTNNVLIVSGSDQKMMSSQNMGTFSEADTVTSVSVSYNGMTTTFTNPPLGVEERRYTINPNGSIIRTA